MKSLCIVLILASFFYLILCDCEFPGIPNGIDVANFKFLKYTENATAFYRCKDPNDIILTENNGNFGLKSYATRYCSRGSWSGLLPQCGMYRSWKSLITNQSFSVGRKGEQS